MTRRLPKILLPVIVFALVAAGLTLASPASLVSFPNPIATGSVRIALTGEGGDSDRIFLPGDAYERSVGVRNTGRNPAYVRVRLESSWKRSDGTPVPDVNGDLIQPVGEDSGDWLRSDDGFWYYQHILQPGEGTGELMRALQIAEHAGKEINGLSVDVAVRAQAIQSEHFPLEGAILSWGEIQPEAAANG